MNLTEPELQAEWLNRRETRLGELQDDIFDKSDWGATFTTDEVNAFLRSGNTGKDPVASPLVAGMNRPRVDVRGDLLILSDRAGSGLFSTVWSLELRVWLVDKEPNLLAVEVAGFYAGSMPLPKRSVMTRMGDAARRIKADVTWFLIFEFRVPGRRSPRALPGQWRLSP